MKCSLVCCTAFVVLSFMYSASQSAECEQWPSHPEWLWCDDFEGENSLTENYQDVGSEGLSINNDDAFEGKKSLCQNYEAGQVDAGWIIRYKEEGFPTHLFMRWYHKFESGFNGFPPKMARMRFRDRSSWSSPMEIHCWINNSRVVADVKANDSKQANSQGWLPIAVSDFSFDDPSNVGRWVCFEMEVLLNSSGEQDGEYRIWADDSLIVERTEVDLRGTENYVINEVMLDCYWNGGSPKEQNRYYDNFVISTKRIGPVNTTAVKYKQMSIKQELRQQNRSQLNLDRTFRPVIISKEINGQDKKYLISGSIMAND